MHCIVIYALYNNTASQNYIYTFIYVYIYIYKENKEKILS